MSEYRTSNNDVLVNPAPLFASCWLALFNELRGSFYDNAGFSDLDKKLDLINEESAKPAISD